MCECIIKPIQSKDIKRLMTKYLNWIIYIYLYMQSFLIRPILPEDYVYLLSEIRIIYNSLIVLNKNLKVIIIYYI